MTGSRREGDWRYLDSSPDAVGMELVGELLDEDSCYSFDTVAVWRHLATGRLYAGADAGCSCPSPFEDVTGLHDLTEIRHWLDLHRFILASAGGRYLAADKMALYRKVNALLKVVPV